MHRPIAVGRQCPQADDLALLVLDELRRAGVVVDGHAGLFQIAEAALLESVPPAVHHHHVAAVGGRGVDRHPVVPFGAKPAHRLVRLAYVRVGQLCVGVAVGDRHDLVEELGLRSVGQVLGDILQVARIRVVDERCDVVNAVEGKAHVPGQGAVPAPELPGRLLQYADAGAELFRRQRRAQTGVARSHY